MIKADSQALPLESLAQWPGVKIRKLSLFYKPQRTCWPSSLAHRLRNTAVAFTRPFSKVLASSKMS